MLKENDLTHIRQTRFRNGDGVTLDFLQDELIQATGTYKIPVSFAKDQVQSGGRFERKVIKDCLMMFHPEHGSNYNYYVFTITRQGTYAFVDVYLAGNSKYGATQNAKNSILSGSFSSLSIYDKGYVIGTLIGNAMGGTLFKNSKSEHEIEKNWYMMIEDVLKDIFGE